MIDQRTISVIITTYHPGRRSTLGLVLDAWDRQPADQIWLLNAGKPFAHDGRAIVFNMPRDLGNGMDYSFAPLTDGDLVVLADDDFMPEIGFLDDMVKGWIAAGGGIVGTIGRRFSGPCYNTQTQYFRAREVERPEPVGFAGVCVMAPRSLFGFDVCGLHRNCDDLWWQMKQFPRVPKHVVPATHYQDLPCCQDQSAMYRQAGDMRETRARFYAEMFAAHYANEDGFDGR